MMNESFRWASRGAVHRAQPAGLRSGMAGVTGGLLMTLALAVAAALAVLFAATLAVIMALATALLAVTALAWRVRPRSQRALARVNRGHAWITYGFDPSAR